MGTLKPQMSTSLWQLSKKSGDYQSLDSSSGHNDKTRLIKFHGNPSNIFQSSPTGCTEGPADVTIHRAANMPKTLFLNQLKGKALPFSLSKMRPQVKTTHSLGIPPKTHREIQNQIICIMQGISSRVFTPGSCLSAEPTQGNKSRHCTCKAKCLQEKPKNQNRTQTY